MTAILMPNGKHKFWDLAGNVLVGGNLYTYEAGTLVPKDTYYDQDATIPNANPVILDIRGEALVRWDGSYKYVLTDANDVVIETVDDFAPSTLILSQSSGAGLIGFDYSLTYPLGSVGRWLSELVIPSGVSNVMTFGATGDGVTNDYAAIMLAKTAAVVDGSMLYFPKGTYFIGTNELVFSENGLVIECDAGSEIRGNGGLDGGHVVTFANAGGTAQPTGNNPTNQRCTGMRIRAVAPFSIDGGRSAMRVSASYSYFLDCSATTSADNGSNGLRLEADNTGTGPYYNTFMDCNFQGPQNGLATGTGLMMRQRAGTAIATRYPNINTIQGGRFGGYAVNCEIAGAGNRLNNVANENAPAFGTAFKWMCPVANANTNNIVTSPYIENASVGFDVVTGSGGAEVNGSPYLSGVTTRIVDPSGHLAFFGYDGVRGMRLAKVPTPSVPRSGLYLGNTANSDLETLDWYQEGPWTPTLTGAPGTPGDYTLTLLGNEYTRIGNVVHIQARMAITINVAGAGAAIFAGLPFPKGSNKHFGGSVILTNVTIAAGTCGVVPAHSTAGSDSTFIIQRLVTGAAPVNLAVTDLLAGAVVLVSITYKVA